MFTELVRNESRTLMYTPQLKLEMGYVARMCFMSGYT